MPAKRRIRLLIILANPVWKIAPPTTNRPIIIITTLSEKPERASLGVKMPNKTNKTSEHIATKSERTFPLIKNTDEINRMASVGYIIIFFCFLLNIKILYLRMNILFFFNI